MEPPVSGANWFRGSSPNSAFVTEEELVFLLQQFDVLFPTEKDCIEELYKRANEEGLSKCRYCEKQTIERQYGERTVWCTDCRKKTWITSGTFFHGIRAVKPWLAAIWFMENGIILSSSKFHKMIGIAQSSALNIFKKVTTVLEQRMQETKVSSGLFVGIFCKRSRETPAREHPVSEQKEIEKATKEGNLSGEAKSFFAVDIAEKEKIEPIDKSVLEMSNEEKKIYDLLSTEPININSLSEKTGFGIQELSVLLTMLELSGTAVRVAGGRYVRNQSGEIDDIKVVARDTGPSDRKNDFIVLGETGDNSKNKTPRKKRKKQAVEACIKFVRHYFHGISRKYVQNYLAGYWWCYSEAKNKNAGKLLAWCMQYGRLDSSDILAYVSPLLVRMIL